jgi:uncharacterized protein (TIGR02117 family)
MAKRILILCLKSLLLIIAFLALYMIAAFTLPHISVNTEFVNKEDSVKIFVRSNGVHTDILVPATNQFKDWTRTFQKGNFDVKDSIHNYLGFGWGDKGFYLDTPTWDDLTFSTAFKATFGLSSTAMHVRYFKTPKVKKEKCVQLFISEDQYKKLIQLIEASFKKQNEEFQKIDHPGYGEEDRFYEAIGTYSAFKTCNVWTNNCLKEIGIKVALWSPFSAGLISSLPQ